MIYYVNAQASRDGNGSKDMPFRHIDDAARIADRLVVFNHGHIAFDGTPEEVFSHTKELMDIGLDVPQSARIAEALRARGVALPDSIYTPDQLLAAVQALRKGAGAC